MVLWGIFVSAFLIGFSGAMMPGPMLGVTIDGSLKKGWTAGPLTVLGHGILKLILIIIMTFGLKDFFSNPTVAGFIGLFGGAFLAWMGYGMIKSSINKSVSLENQGAGNSAGMRNLVLAGALDHHSILALKKHVKPDIIAVRGAACVGQRRQAQIQRDRVQSLVRCLRED